MSDNVVWHPGAVTPRQRWAATGGRGATLWFTGLSASGKSTIAAAVEARLVHAGRPAYLLDGDNLRHGLNADLGFSAPDRAENVRRVAEVARLLADAGVVALTTLISPYAAGRAHARTIHDGSGLPFAEIWVSTPLSVCEARDPKGLYARARAGEISGFTGVDDPYEPPARPDLELPAHQMTLEDAVAAVMRLLEERGVICR